MDWTGLSCQHTALIGLDWVSRKCNHVQLWVWCFRYSWLLWQQCPSYRPGDETLWQQARRRKRRYF